MVFKILKKKNRILSEPVFIEQTFDEICTKTKPITYYSVDKKAYVTVLVPEYMNIYTNTNINNTTTNTNKNNTNNTNTNNTSTNNNNISTNTNNTNKQVIQKESDILHEIYDYYLNNDKEDDVVKITNDNYITSHFQYDINNDMYYYSTKNSDKYSVYSGYSVYSSYSDYSIYSEYTF
jgi:hypothetical protein